MDNSKVLKDRWTSLLALADKTAVPTIKISNMTEKLNILKLIDLNI